MIREEDEYSFVGSDFGFSLLAGWATRPGIMFKSLVKKTIEILA
jgi:hypothetical protein